MAGDVRLLIAVASGRGWSTGFGYSLAAMMLRLGLRRLEGRLAKVELVVKAQAYLVKARNDHLVEAISGDYTHFLSLDDDMTFPPDLVDKLLAADKPVVTCNYRKKKPELDCVCGYPDGSAVSSTNKTGLERVHSMGMGITMVRVADIRHVPGPYFAVFWNGDECVIEDGVFSNVLARNGVEIWCDHDLSREIGHIGETVYRLPQLTEAPAEVA